MTRGDAGAFGRKPVEADFYRRFAPVALERGWLRLYALKAGGRIRAMQIGYRYGDAFLALQDGFDPEFVAGVGNVLRHYVIEASVRHPPLRLPQRDERTQASLGRGGATAPVRAAPRAQGRCSGHEMWPTGRYRGATPACCTRASGARGGEPRQPDLNAPRR
jgi:hypothetical protein